MWLNNKFLIAMALFASSASATNPVGFTYQGQLFSSSGAPSADTVDLIIQIYDPSATCLLYEEDHHAINLAASNGNFSVQVGSPLLNAVRTSNDPGLSMTQVFNNLPNPVRNTGSTLCTSGYTPISGDQRRLRVTVVGPSGNDVLSPDQNIGSAPFALSAETLQGKQPGDFLQNTLSNMQASIEALVNGTSTLYVRADGSNLMAPLNMNGQRVTSIAAPMLGTDAVNKNYSDQNLDGRSISSVAPAAGQVLMWNATNSQWQASSPVDSTVQAQARVPATACTAGQASQWTGSAWNCIAVASSSGAGGAAAPYTGASGTVTLTSASPKVNIISYTSSGMINLPDATTLSTGGPLFTLFSGSNIVVPVYDGAGGFVGGLQGNTQSDLFLLDNSTAGGQWRGSGNGLVPTATEATVNSSFNFTTSVYPNTMGLAYLGGTTFAFPYQSGPSTYLLAYTANASAKTVAWGTPVVVPTLTGNVNAFVGLSSTTAVLFRSDYIANVVTFSGTTITVGPDISSVTCTDPSAKYRKLDAAHVICAAASGASVSGSVMAVSGSNITANPLSLSVPASYNTVDVVPLSSTSAVLMAKDSSTNALMAHVLSASGFTVGPANNVLAQMGYNYPQWAPNSGSSYLISATNFLYQITNQNGAVALLNLSLSGTTINVLSNQIVATNVMGTGGALYYDGSTLWSITSGMYGGASRVAVTNVTSATPTLSSPLPSNDCNGFIGYRVSRQRCIGSPNTYQVAPTDTEFQLPFIVGM